MTPQSPYELGLMWLKLYEKNKDFARFGIFRMAGMEVYKEAVKTGAALPIENIPEESKARYWAQAGAITKEKDKRVQLSKVLYAYDIVSKK